MANTKGKNTKRKTKAAQKQAAKCQLYSVIGFAVAVFILCVVFIKGENVWLMLHNFTFGVFGVTAYAVPFFIGILSIVLALEKMTNNALAKLIEGGALIALLGAAVDIFSKHSPNISFWAHLGNAYLSGTHLKSGGFLATCSCSHYMTLPLFEKMLSDAAKESGRRVRVAEMKMQAPDHPSLVNEEETQYLKFFVLQVL